MTENSISCWLALYRFCSSLCRQCERTEELKHNFPPTLYYEKFQIFRIVKIIIQRTSIYPSQVTFCCSSLIAYLCIYSCLYHSIIFVAFKVSYRHKCTLLLNTSPWILTEVQFCLKFPCAPSQSISAPTHQEATLILCIFPL